MSWEQMNFSDVWFWPETFIGSSNGSIFVGLVDTAHHSGFGVVYKSENYGYDWSPTNSGGSAVSSLILDKNEYIYAGTAASWWGSCQGIIRTTNDGESWESFSSGIAQGSCGFVLGCNSEGNLFAGTETGFYKTIESTTEINENQDFLPTDFKLFQNFPNPFNPSTTIKYHLPQSGKVNLKVFDLVG